MVGDGGGGRSRSRSSSSSCGATTDVKLSEKMLHFGHGGSVRGIMNELNTFMDGWMDGWIRINEIDSEILGFFKLTVLSSPFHSLQ